MPDFATHLRYEGDLGHLQVAGLVRTIGYQPTGGDVERLTGVGRQRPTWSSIRGPSLLGTNPVQDESIRTDAQPHPAARQLGPRRRAVHQRPGRPGTRRPGRSGHRRVRTVAAVGWNASYEHWFNEHWPVELHLLGSERRQRRQSAGHHLRRRPSTRRPACGGFRSRGCRSASNTSGASGGTSTAKRPSPSGCTGWCSTTSEHCSACSLARTRRPQSRSRSERRLFASLSNPRPAGYNDGSWGHSAAGGNA